MNKEKLIEKMREVSDGYVQDLIEQVPEAAHYLLMNDIAENMSKSFAEAALTLISREWVRVEDRLPEKDGNVLCLANGTEYVLWHSNGKFYMDFHIKKYFEDWAEHVTHWMSLPTPPKQ